MRSKEEIKRIVPKLDADLSKLLQSHGFAAYKAKEGIAGLLIVRQDKSGKIAILAIGQLNPFWIANDILSTVLNTGVPVQQEPNPLAS